MTTQHEPGGPLPPIGALFSETIDDLTKNLQGYLLAGLGLMAVIFPVSMVISFVAIFGMNLTIVLGSVASAMAGEATGDETAKGLVTLIGTFGSIGVAVFGMFVLLSASIAISAPFSASVQRAIAAHQRGEGTLGFGSAFESPRENVLSAVVVLALTTAAAFVGMLFCYVGAFVPAMLFSFAPAMVALHRKGALAALSRCARHAVQHPGDHALFALVWFGTAMIAANIPVLGYAFLIALNVRAYRKVFGDGPEPAGV